MYSRSSPRPHPYRTPPRPAASAPLADLVTRNRLRQGVGTGSLLRGPGYSLPEDASAWDLHCSLMAPGEGRHSAERSRQTKEWCTHSYRRSIVLTISTQLSYTIMGATPAVIPRNDTVLQHGVFPDEV